MALTPATRSAYSQLVGGGKRLTRVRISRLYSTVSSEPEDCDVVIVGGGPAGLALANALGKSVTSCSPILRGRQKIAIIEAGDLTKVRNWSPAPGTFSNRVSSLTNASQTFLKEFGGWGHVNTERTCPVEEMQVWDGISDARINFSAEEIGLEAPKEGMARITENLNLQRSLLASLSQLPVELIDRTKVQTISRDSDDSGGWPLVHLDNGQTLRARLLVGADGFNSPVRSYAGISSFGWSYDTQAIVATLVHPPRGAYQNPNTTAYQRFLPTGPIAFLPLSATVSSLVWSTRPHIASALLASDPQILVSMINAAYRLPDVSIRYLYDRILEAQANGSPLTPAEFQKEVTFREQSHGIDSHSAYASAVVQARTEPSIASAEAELVPPLVTSIQPGTIASFPLKFNHADAYIGEGAGARTALVGDAAHTIHPLAGQGLNMGLSDVECLSRCIINTLLQGGDIGSYTALLPYAQERYLANHSLMGAIDKMHKLYTTTFGPAVWARSVGVEVLNEFDSIKAALMMTAGAQSQSRSGSTSAWSAVAKGVEIAVTANNVGKTLARGVYGLLEDGLKSLSRTHSEGNGKI